MFVPALNIKILRYSITTLLIASITDFLYEQGPKSRRGVKQK